MTQTTTCPKCRGLGTVQTPIDLTDKGLSCSSVTSPCDCLAGQEWNRKAVAFSNRPGKWIKL